MGKSKVLVKVHPEGKYVVDIDKDIDIAELTPGVCVCDGVGGGSAALFRAPALTSGVCVCVCGRGGWEGG